MRFHLPSSFRKNPKPAPLPTPLAQHDPLKQAEADERASTEATKTILELKSYFVGVRQPSNRVLCQRGNTIDVAQTLPEGSQTIPGRHYQSPVTVRDFSRKLLAAVNTIEAKAQEQVPGKAQSRLIRATEAVKALMSQGSFTDTPQLRDAVHELWQRQRAMA
jgi:hypothetical protein